MSHNTYQWSSEYESIKFTNVLRANANQNLFLNQINSENRENIRIINFEPETEKHFFVVLMKYLKEVNHFNKIKDVQEYFSTLPIQKKDFSKPSSLKFDQDAIYFICRFPIQIGNFSSDVGIKNELILEEKNLDPHKPEEKLFYTPDQTIELMKGIGYLAAHKKITTTKEELEQRIEYLLDLTAPNFSF